MKKHIKNFIKHYNLAEGEIMMCQYCGNKPVVDVEILDKKPLFF